jgi:hypothetical protein
MMKMEVLRNSESQLKVFLNHTFFPVYTKTAHWGLSRILYCPRL